MTEIHLLSQDDRELFFRSAAELMNLRFEVVEKDFWVVWILERLFSIEKIKRYLTFKGGTALSKVFKVIERFSEDVDLSIEKEILGFSGEKHPENAPSRKKQQAALDDLSKACSKYIQNILLADLQEVIASKIEKTKWRLYVDLDDPDGQTLLFEYPSKSSHGGYIRPLVKIEIGARSEHWPVSKHRIQSYVKTALSDKIYEPDIWVQVLDAERTFWEKATILHQYAHLPQEKKLPPRISRHYYDFFQLLNSDIKPKALKEVSLLERVANHKSIYFASGWANYAQARQGTLKLSPPAKILKELQEDYALMEPMFFNEFPQWNKVLETIEQFEKEFNTG